MNSYNPRKAPAPDAWLEMDEAQRLDLVVHHHRNDDLPNLEIHAAIHTIVENQLAEDLTEVLDALDRLTRDGLDRHDAIHAIGFVLVEQIQEVLQGGVFDKESEQAYFQGLKDLTAETWLEQGE